MSKSVAIITARGGSKRIPRKNIKNFCGQPIIKYSIDAALKAGCFNEVMVSTDDEEIAEIARKFGAKVPFVRSQKNSDDYSTTADVIKEVILEYQKLGQDYKYLCCIYPTAPFVTSNLLSNSIKKLIETDADCVLPIVKYSYPIQRSLKIANGKAVMNWPENYLKRSQDLEPIYHDSGQFYSMKSSSLLDQMVLFAKNTIPVIIPETEVQDIDNEEDWKIAEIKYKMLKNID
jgi:pseudaminic acid cytidylyltransferase